MRDKRGCSASRKRLPPGFTPSASVGSRNRGQLTRVGRGLYALPVQEATEYHTLAEIAKRVPKGIVCLLTALRFHGLGTQNPREVWLAVDRRAGIPRVDFAPIRLVRISGAALTSGVDERDIDNVAVRITSPARTVVDSFKFRNKIGIDVRGRGAEGVPAAPHRNGR